VHYPVPLHMQSALSHMDCGKGSLPVAECAAGRVMSLPMHPYLQEHELHHIVARVRAALEVAE